VLPSGRFVFRIVSELGRGIEIGFEWKDDPGADHSDPVKAGWRHAMRVRKSVVAFDVIA